MSSAFRRRGWRAALDGAPNVALDRARREEIRGVVLLEPRRPSSPRRRRQRPAARTSRIGCDRRKHDAVADEAVQIRAASRIETEALDGDGGDAKLEQRQMYVAVLGGDHPVALPRDVVEERRPRVLHDAGSIGEDDGRAAATRACSGASGSRSAWRESASRQSSTIAASVFHESAFGGKMPITGFGRSSRPRPGGADSPSMPASRTSPVIGPLGRRAADGLFAFENRELKSSGGENGVG